MSRSTFLHAQSATNITAFKSTFQPISDALKANFTQTTDTGQVVWASLSALPSQQAIAVYEVYRFNDALQATAPIFIRVDYVNYSNVSPWIFWRVGTGTDGAGNLTGVTTPAHTSGSTPAMATITNTVAVTTTQTLNGYVSNFDGSQMVVTTGLSNAGTGTGTDNTGTFVVERFRNADGTPNADGYMTWAWNNFTTGGTQFGYQYSRIFALPAAQQPPLDYTPPIAMAGIGNMATLFSGSTSTALPFYGWGPYPRGASQAVLYGFQQDYPRATEVAVTHYAKTAKFIALGSSASYNAPYFAAVATASQKIGMSPLFRWE